jgi:CubicO group peptidase (beta-lactamase class C family)
MPRKNKTGSVKRRGLQLAILCASLVIAAAPAAAFDAVEEPKAGSSPRGANRLAKAERFGAAKALIHKLVHEQGVPSISVAVAKDGKVLWEEGFGWADRERRIRATPHTPYATGSTLKPMTATAIMALHERGKLNLDAPIEDYIGPLQLKSAGGEKSQATVRRVLSHTAGLPLYYYFYPEGQVPMTPQQAVDRYGFVVYPPGKQYFYSNLGFGLLGEAVARTSGRKFGEFLQSEVFEPLGMQRTGVGLTAPWANQVAARYDMKHRPIPTYTQDITGAGDAHSSAHDLLRFGMFFVGTPLPGQKQVIRPETIRLMHTFAGPANTLDRYGLGWFTDEHHGFRRVHHGGYTSGVLTQFALYPDERLAVVVLANQYNGDLPKVTDEIVAAILPGYAAKLREAQKPKGERTYEQELAEITAMSGALPKFAGKWSGSLTTYEGLVPFSLTFQPDGDIHVNIGTQYTGLLDAVTNFGGQLMGRMAGTMPTTDARKYRHSLLLLLRPEADELVGQLVAQTIADPDIYSLPGAIRIKQERKP